MRASDKQVRTLFRALARGDALGRAAMKADLCPNTARRYAGTGLLPSAATSDRTWRTHEDAFSGDWPEIEARLVLSPTLRANTLFDDLVARFPGRYEPGQLRTLQRWWRHAEKGPPGPLKRGRGESTYRPRSEQGRALLRGPGRAPYGAAASLRRARPSFDCLSR
jgi:hypothetical protein